MAGSDWGSDSTDPESVSVLEHEDPSVLAWYDARRPMFIDLVGDYAGKELFLVEGDSLLRQCFEDERIDFHDGFQMLHAAFVVERFLENLTKRHCQYHIAFFDEHRELCIPAGIPKERQALFLLARSVMIRHLSANLPTSNPSVEVHTFASPRSEEFEKYLETTAIYFVMAHDGARPTVGAVDEDADGQAMLMFRGLIWWFNMHDLNVSLINRIEFRDSKVFTMIIEGGSDMELIENGFEDSRTKFPVRDVNIAAAEKALSQTAIIDLLKESGESITPESWFVNACTLATRLSNANAESFLTSAFALHVVLIKHLSLSQRRLPLTTFDEAFDARVSAFLEGYSETTADLLSSPYWAETMKEHDVECDVIDVVDGRLFRSVIQSMLNGSLQENTLPQSVIDDWSSVCEVILALSGVTLSICSPSEIVADVVNNDTEGDQSLVEVSEVAVMKFSNSVFDKHLASIQIETESAAERSSTKIYRETTHWHNHRKPLNPKHAPAEKVSKWKNPLRLNQFYMAEMTSYAASLTGAKGKALEPETITVGVKKLGKASDESSSPVPENNKHVAKAKPGKAGKSEDATPAAKKGGKKAAAGLSKAQQIIADNREKKGGAESDKAFTAWTGIMKGFDEISGDQERYLKAKVYLNGLDPARAVHVELDVSAYLLQCLLIWWAKYCKEEKKSEGYHVVALIFTEIRSISTSKAAITKEVHDIVQKLSTVIGITDATAGLSLPTVDRKLSFTFKYAITKDIKIELSQTDFQLLHVGPYMDRNLDAQPDARVSSFVPDGWQRKVLDELDADNSVFVVAPTSAGKTFISFYAMEKVLRGDNDGVLVYVAPTKALVNQIAAEIQGRFSKKYTQAGKSVWAIHTRDYRVNNSTGCQILVTVPHILQIMLLAPNNAKSWSTRVKRIIFDEIHCIGAAEDGVVWEQLLLLSPCPIIALSATIGNPAQFSEWLSETQKAYGTKLTMIQHSTRYSDLRKYLYEAPETFEFEGLGKTRGSGLGLDGAGGLTFFHPVAALTDKSRGMPDDLALEPRDCFLLWKAMCKFQTEDFKVPSALDPAKALPKVVKKVDIFKWEKALKATLQQWMTDIESPFDKVVQEVSPVVAPASNKLVASSGQKSVDPKDLRQTTLPLLYELNQRQALPAILFNYDRSACEDIAFHLLTQLKDAEDKWKTGKEWQRKLDGWTKWKELKEKKAAKKPAKVSKKKGGDDDEKTSKADQARDEASSDVSLYDLFDPEAPQDDFSFADKRKAQKSEIDEYVRKLRWKHIPEQLLELLQRGVGVHHSGMNRKYRQCVEMLFRKGYLRVVIATGTLSMGINMPCNTVVFSGDSVFLTALNFRQAAGRSGRRGFDLLGNVVFQGVTPVRASRLLSSRLPDLTGHFPITTTLVLRLFTLLHDSKNSKYAVAAINSLLSQPRLYLGGDSFKEQVLHHLRFSIEYLRRQSLLGPSGEPVNFTSCVSHLYFTENSSFAFHALLKNGYFSKLCADIDNKPEPILRSMMLVMSHLFGRQVCRETGDEKMREKIRLSPSMVFLPPLPEEAATVLRQHNANTLAIFTTYVKSFAAQHIKGEETKLPLTHVRVGHHEGLIQNGNAKGGAEANGSAIPSQQFDFLPSLPRPQARSAFVALSGHGDNFSTINDLCSSARSDIFLESAVIPHLELHPDESRTPLNAYLLDFFTHGSFTPLSEANGIPRSDVWFLLNDFSLVLATICTSLTQYLGLGPKGRESDDEMLDVMGGGDAGENDRDEEEAAVAVPAPSAPAAPVAPVVIRKGKKGVADEWGADEDAIVAREKSAADGEGVQIGTDDEEYDKLVNVYKGFRKLKTEFDAKFVLTFA